MELSPRWRKALQRYKINIKYTSSKERWYHDPDKEFLVNVKRTCRIILPILSFQIRMSTLPLSITSYPIVPCHSKVFSLCFEGDVVGVKSMIENSQISPFVVNQHGENLLHASARYARIELCLYLLAIGVDGSAYDDRLLTPLDHLASKVPMDFAYPSRVVDTIRALVEHSRCQPLMPLTSNAVAPYRGPEEGFSWLFNSEYSGANLDDYDSEGYTPLGDAAFNFGWWTELLVDDPPVGWQSCYLLKAGADPHKKSSLSGLTPLDTFLRGCTAHQVDHAAKWLQILSQNGIDLHEYARQEQRLHSDGHYIMVAWDQELFKWIPTKQRVLFEYGETPNDLKIWIEDYDALSWFWCGKYDLDIFDVCSVPQSIQRWKEINSRNEREDIDVEENMIGSTSSNQAEQKSLLSIFLKPGWLLIISLLVNYVFHRLLILVN
ncbi:hypothetical protein F5884DRAFT_731605 [Xylogone sp. PMI_703]|nr:hypothetical protein F5884DRAFT_731605 [Xylogone sp. PMI_703]